jgi:hypothetical protein
LGNATRKPRNTAAGRHLGWTAERRRGLADATYSCTTASNGWGWDVLIADAAKVRGLAPLACQTDKIDARVLALLSHRDLGPVIWLPDPRVRRERELARVRMHLVKDRSMLKHRIHATLISFGHPCRVSDLLGVAGRELLDRIDVPPPWPGTVDAGLRLIDDLDRQIDTINRELRASGADHPYVACSLPVAALLAAIAALSRWPSWWWPRRPRVRSRRS